MRAGLSAHIRTHMRTHTSRYANRLRSVYIRLSACVHARVCVPPSTQYARGGTHHLQNITDNRVEINDPILINA